MLLMIGGSGFAGLVTVASAHHNRRANGHATIPQRSGYLCAKGQATFPKRSRYLSRAICRVGHHNSRLTTNVGHLVQGQKMVRCDCRRGRNRARYAWIRRQCAIPHRHTCSRQLLRVSLRYRHQGFRVRTDRDASAACIPFESSKDILAHDNPDIRLSGLLRRSEGHSSAYDRIWGISYPWWNPFEITGKKAKQAHRQE